MIVWSGTGSRAEGLILNGKLVEEQKPIEWSNKKQNHLIVIVCFLSLTVWIWLDNEIVISLKMIAHDFWLAMKITLVMDHFSMYIIMMKKSKSR